MKKFEKFKIDATVETTVFMSTDDIGGDKDVEVGTLGTVFSEPSDPEELVGVYINSAYHYLPQDVLKVALKVHRKLLKYSNLNS